MNIALTGMPAVGKTTIAKELEKLLNIYTIIDTDEKIIENEKITIPEIFKTKGEGYFRSLETRVLKEILKFDNQIISTGGGIIKTDENLVLLKSKSTLIYLKADIETLVNRAKNSNNRPLLNDCDIKEKLNQLLNERENKYEQAEYIINTEKKSPQEIAKEITEKINGNN